MRALGAMVVLAACAAPRPMIPHTPAGATLQAWLDSRGFDLLSIEKSDEHAIRFVMKSKDGPAIGWLKLAGDAVRIDFTAIPRGLAPRDMDPPVDAATRAHVIDTIATKLDEMYVDPDVAKKLATALRAHRHEYDAIADSRAFASLLTEHLQAASHDKHLRVAFVPTSLPGDNAQPCEEDKAEFRDQLVHDNCGFHEVKHLAGNIGYVKLDMFGDVETCGPKATAVLGQLRGVDSVIIDLRDNGGGQPDMVAFVASYLFADRTHLGDFYDRPSGQTSELWTRDVPGERFTKPVYILTSKATFSAAEELTYDLKSLARATVVGETTGGGAHPTRGVRIDTHFLLGVPTARAINPVTKTNWEGTGVTPDVDVPAERALEIAMKLASPANRPAVR